jgi:hypothetical protein
MATQSVDTTQVAEFFFHQFMVPPRAGKHGRKTATSVVVVVAVVVVVVVVVVVHGGTIQPSVGLLFRTLSLFRGNTAVVAAAAAAAAAAVVVVVEQELCHGDEGVFGGGGGLKHVLEFSISTQMCRDSHFNLAVVQG